MKHILKSRNTVWDLLSVCTFTLSVGYYSQMYHQSWCCLTRQSQSFSKQVPITSGWGEAIQEYYGTWHIIHLVAGRLLSAINIPVADCCDACLVLGQAAGQGWPQPRQLSWWISSAPHLRINQLQPSTTPLPSILYQTPVYCLACFSMRAWIWQVLCIINLVFM